MGGGVEPLLTVTLFATVSLAPSLSVTLQAHLVGAGRGVGMARIGRPCCSPHRQSSSCARQCVPSLSLDCIGEAAAPAPCR